MPIGTRRATLAPSENSPHPDPRPDLWDDLLQIMGQKERGLSRRDARFVAGVADEWVTGQIPLFRLLLPRRIESLASDKEIARLLMVALYRAIVTGKLEEK